jgi:hypothetical protein
MAKKNNASEIINNPTPIFKPLCTAKVWFPKYVPSEITSLNQKNILETRRINAAGNQLLADENPCIVNTPEVVKVNRLIQVNIGQGEGDTKWKGCPWKALLFKLDIKTY